MAGKGGWAYQEPRADRTSIVEVEYRPAAGSALIRCDGLHLRLIQELDVREGVKVAQEPALQVQVLNNAGHALQVTLACVVVKVGDGELYPGIRDAIPDLRDVGSREPKCSVCKVRTWSSSTGHVRCSST